MREVPDNIRGRHGAASEVFAVRGFDATRIDDIAEATGVPKATLYYYFKSKEDILAHLLGTMLETIGDGVKHATSSAGSPKDRLAKVIHAQLGVMAQRPATAGMHEIAVSGELNAERLAAQLVPLVMDGVARPQLPPQRPRH